MPAARVSGNALGLDVCPLEVQMSLNSLVFNGFGTVNVPLGYPFRVLINLTYLERNLLEIFTDLTYHEFSIDVPYFIYQPLYEITWYLGPGT